jgi:hypothetical protein
MPTSVALARILRPSSATKLKAAANGKLAKTVGGLPVQQSLFSG